VVSEAQATLRMLDETVIGLDSDHVNLVRFKDHDAMGYRRFSSYIRRLVEKKTTPKTVVDTQQILRPIFVTTESHGPEALESTLGKL
jgi:hypothetical protein